MVNCISIVRIYKKKKREREVNEMGKGKSCTKIIYKSILYNDIVFKNWVFENSRYD